MTDIVKRLRRPRIESHWQLMMKADDEIERLRAELEHEKWLREQAERFSSAIMEQRDTAQTELAAIKGQEPPDFVTLLKAAEQIVKSKSVWKRFIDGTPLDNDIPVWMATFVQEYQAMPVAPADKDAEREYTDEELTRIYNKANGIDGKNPPITTERIFAAMRAMAKGE